MRIPAPCWELLDGRFLGHRLPAHVWEAEEPPAGSSLLEPLAGCSQLACEHARWALVLGFDETTAPSKPYNSAPRMRKVGNAYVCLKEIVQQLLAFL